ncbi:MAG: phospholipid-binding protein [Planctomycetes bacterium]|nr:phospholipid-binding protein [Planctomycetota bacterium]
MTPQALVDQTPGLADCSVRELADTVERCVRLRTGGTIRSLHVEVTAGEVILSGHTSTYYNKQLATHAALDAAKELSLTNEIKVC